MPPRRDAGFEPTAPLLDDSGRDPTVGPTVPGLGHDPPAALDESGSTRPARLGRFALLGELGRGGMGVVHAAYDDRLDRKVAIKLLKVGALEAGGEREDLLREAQAMAKLSHPNVVQVYEVGEHRDRLFIAMEFVDGGSLRDWMSKGPHPWREVIATFGQAGRGLAAAHARGLVHADFKPDNVLLDEAGRARITDFGLTRMIADSEATLEDGDNRATSIRGTPAFMAPEQWEGRRADARSDQYAFCVALYEALWGARPFTGKSLAALEIAVTSGEMEPLEDSRGVPDRIRRAILRGLSREPDERWPSMKPLLRELTRDRWKAARPWAAATGAGLALAVGVILLTADDDDRCKDAASAFADTWGPAQRARVEDAFGASARPFAGQAGDGVVSALDELAAAWSAMRVEACEATWNRGEQSEAALDLRMACLDRQRDQVGAFVARFVEADDAVVESAADALERLPSVAACADVEALRAAYPPPADALRGEVAAVELEVDEATATFATGHFAEGLPLAEEAYRRAKELGYPPTAARAGIQWGMYLNEDKRGRAAQGVLLETLKFAAAARDPEAEVAAWSHLIFAVATEAADMDRGVHWAVAAEAALERLDDPRGARAEVAQHVAGLQSRRGDYEAANAKIGEAIAIFEELGTHKWSLANALGTKAAILVNEGRSDEAIEVARRARALVVAQAGETHPAVFGIDHNIALAHLQASRYDEAATAFVALLEKREAVLGAKHPSLIQELGSLSNARYMQGKHDEAAALLERAHALAVESLPPDDPTQGQVAIGLAGILKDRGETDRAAALYRKAHTDLEASMGADNPMTLAAVNGLGLLEMERGNYAEAVVHLRAANEGFDPEDPERARTLLGLTDTLAALGNPDEATKANDDGLALMRKLGGDDHPLLPYMLCSRARLLLARGDHDGAHDAYLEALGHYERTLGPDAAPVAIPLLGLGHIAATQNKRDESLGFLERAVKVADSGGLGQMMRLDARLALATVLSTDRAQYPRARELVESARTALPEDHIKRKQADAFLASLEN